MITILELLDSGQYREYPESDFSDLNKMKKMGLVKVIGNEFNAKPLYVAITPQGAKLLKNYKNS